MKTYIVLTLALVICFHAGLVMSAFNVNDEDAVRNNTLFASGYNHLSRPAATTEVDIGLSLASIDELDIQNSIFGATGWMIVIWIDERLAWDPATYGEIKSIVVPRSHIWTPDLDLDSLFEDYKDFAEADSNIRYDNTGMVVWKQWRNFKLYCQIGRDYFPGEKQTCTLDVVGSSYNVSEVSLGFITTAIDIKNIRKAVDFKITETRNVSSTVVVTVNNETSLEYPRLEFLFKIQRGFRRLYAFVVPMWLTLILISCTFLIPFELGERLSYIQNLYLSLTFLITVLSDEMPSEYIGRNHLLLIPAFTMVVGAEAILFTVLLSMYYRKKERNITLSDLKNINQYKEVKLQLKTICMLSKSTRHKINALMEDHPSPSDATARNTEGSVLTTELIVMTPGTNTDELTTAEQILKDALLVILKDGMLFIDKLVCCLFVVQGLLFGLFIAFTMKGRFYNYNI